MKPDPVPLPRPSRFTERPCLACRKPTIFAFCDGCAPPGRSAMDEHLRETSRGVPAGEHTGKKRWDEFVV